MFELKVSILRSAPCGVSSWNIAAVASLLFRLRPHRRTNHRTRAPQPTSWKPSFTQNQYSRLQNLNNIHLERLLFSQIRRKKGNNVFRPPVPDYSTAHAYVYVYIAMEYRGPRLSLSFFWNVTPRGLCSCVISCRHEATHPIDFLILFQHLLFTRNPLSG